MQSQTQEPAPPAVSRGTVAHLDRLAARVQPHLLDRNLRPRVHVQRQIHLPKCPRAKQLAALPPLRGTAARTTHAGIDCV